MTHLLIAAFLSAAAEGMGRGLRNPSVEPDSSRSQLPNETKFEVLPIASYDTDLLQLLDGDSEQ